MEDHRYTGLMRVCFDEEVIEAQVSHADWWPEFVKHVNNTNPGYCVVSIQAADMPHGLVIIYSLRSPDGKEIIRDSMDCKQHTEI